MRIGRPVCTPEHARHLAGEIAEAVERKGVDGRVCGSACALRCVDCGSKICRCMCSAHCSNAPKALSSDPLKHPIETGITPLVYQMKRLGIFEPCWSCEGHLGLDGLLWKAPSVWFYCNSTVNLGLLSAGIDRLSDGGKLTHHWRVVVTFSDNDNPETAFALEPILPTDREASLPELQQDIYQIAQSLEGLMVSEARTLQANTRAALASTD